MDSLVRMVLLKLSVSPENPVDTSRVFNAVYLLPSRSETKTGSCSGLLVDWLEHLDPEVTSVCPDLQQKLLFALNKVNLSCHCLSLACSVVTLTLISVALSFS